MDQARLKYRIVGGIVLVALAAILVPVLSDMRRPLPQGPQAIDIPAEPTDGLASRLPADAPPVQGSVPEPADIPPPAPPPPLGEDADVSPPDAELAPPRAPAVQARPPVPVARPAPASPPRVPAAVAKPTPAAKPAVVARPEPAPAAKPVAPAPIPAAKPAAPAPVATAASPSVQQAWVVQLGAFGNFKTAIDLREKLRKAGHSAFTEEITTPQGKALRVRVGPELDRAKALALRDRLAKETGHDGIVVAYP